MTSNTTHPSTTTDACAQSASQASPPAAPPQQPALRGTRAKRPNAKRRTQAPDLKPDPIPDPFTFRLKARRIVIPTDSLLAALQEFRDAMGARRFTVAQYQAWERRPASAGTIINRFGSWRSALDIVGVRGVRARTYTPDELIERLEFAWKKLGRAPGRHTLRRVANISANPYARRWGSVQSACAALARFHAGQLSRAELLRPRATPQRPAIRPSLRFAILRRDNHTCQCCGRAAGEPNVKLELDHIRPISQGGQTTRENLRTLCQDCNRGKAAA